MTDSDDRKLARLREMLPATGAGIFLDTATRGPIPAETAAAMREADDWELRVGRAAEGREEDTAQRLAEGRAVIAALLGGDSANIALTTGVGQALSIAASTVDWQRGDRVLTVADTSADVLAALAGLRQRFGVEVDLAVTPDPGALVAAVTPRTRLAMLPQVTAGTGELVDIAEIADRLRASPAWIVVDASLSAGAVPIDVETLGADMVAVSGDRWLLGPEGTGGLWVGARVLEDGLAGLTGSGGYETLHAAIAQLWPDARRFEPGGPSRTAALGLARSVGWLEMYVGLAWALARGQALARRLRGALDGAAGVEVLTPARAMATIVAFRLTGWPAGAAADELRRRVFAIIGRVDEPDALRASVAWFNTEDEIDRFAAATVELARYTPETVPRRPAIIVQ